MIFCIFSDVEGMGNIWFLLAFISKNCSLMSCYLIYYYRYDLRKWSDRYEYIRRWRSALNDVFCGGKLPSINKPVNSQCFEVYFISFPPLYRILFLIFSIVALGTHGYFYCGCILYVFLTDDVLQQVLTAIRRSGGF